MKLGKYMLLEKAGDEWRIVNARTRGWVGKVSYYAPWRQYVLEVSDRVFSADCLHEIEQFLWEVNRQKKEEAPPCAG